MQSDLSSALLCRLHDDWVDRLIVSWTRIQATALLKRGWYPRATGSCQAAALLLGNQFVKLASCLPCPSTYIHGACSFFSVTLPLQSSCISSRLLITTGHYSTCQDGPHLHRFISSPHTCPHPVSSVFCLPLPQSRPPRYIFSLRREREVY
jgi:hypothetical protein